MKILEFMSFNPSWFLTIPGILITVGIILLIISLILLLTGKDKTEEKVEVETKVPEQVSDINQNTNVVAEPVAVPSIPVEEEQTLPVNPGVVDLNVSAPVVEENTTNKAPEVQIFEPTSTVPIENVKMEPIAENKIETAPSVDTPIEVAAPSVSIYGGVNPSSDLYKVNESEQKPTIYGGANPLENTAPIPTMNNDSIYNVPNQEVKIIEPSVQNIEPVKTAVVDNGNTSAIPASNTVQTDVTSTSTAQIAPSNEIEELEF